MYNPYSQFILRYCNNRVVYCLQFDHVYFTDVIYWKFILDVTPVEMTEAVSVLDATTPYEAYSNMIYRANNIKPDGYYYATPLDYLTYLVQPTVSTGNEFT